jgi:hypothetical protein
MYVSSMQFNVDPFNKMLSKKIFASFLCSEVYLLDEVRCNSSLKVDSLMSCFCQCWLIFIDYTEGVFYGRYFGTI